MSANHLLRCSKCTLIASPADWRCSSCGGLLHLEWTSTPGRERVDPNRGGVWRYRPLLPEIRSSSIITLGEGATPLIWLDRWAAAHRLDRVGVKLEYISPTGSFKDRGTTTLVSRAVELDLNRIVEDSSGNAGASVAAYAVRAGLPVTIFVPSAAPAAKRAQIERVGAAIVPIDGSRSAVTEAALAEVASSGAYYAGHNANPYFAAGMATFAYELIEQLWTDLPRHLVIPTGGGSLVVGAHDGFRRWLGGDPGATGGIPRFHAVQPVGCAPLVAALAEGLDDVPLIRRYPTVAGGIEVERPPRGRDILKVLRETGGSAVAVDDDEILRQRRLLASLEGIDVEPTTAAAFAGLAQLARSGAIRPMEPIVVAATGAGWKDPG
ncbi:MAG TPA: threonine synthase [Chloroflexota bacterium]|nr:threonine synthase [Chloroflexota bacterium]